MVALESIVEGSQVGATAGLVFALEGNSSDVAVFGVELSGFGQQTFGFELKFLLQCRNLLYLRLALPSVYNLVECLV